MVGICAGRCFIYCYCLAYGKLSIYKSGHCKPCEEFKNGMRTVNGQQLTVNRKIRHHYIRHQKLSFMFKNYLKTALRNLGRNKLYSSINIFGLMIGLAACLLIGVYINHELSYDKFNANASRIVRATMEYSRSCKCLLG